MSKFQSSWVQKAHDLLLANKAAPCQFVIECRQNPDELVALMQAEGITVNWTYPEHNSMGVSGIYEDIEFSVERNPQFFIAICGIDDVQGIAAGMITPK